MNRRRRREYLLQKENEERERTILHNKRILKHCLDNNTNLPHDLKPQAGDLLQEIFFDVGNKEMMAGLDSFPEIISLIITTSRDPSDKLKHFAKRLANILGGSSLPRGNLGIKELGQFIESSNSNGLIVVNECRGVATSLSISIYPYGPTYYFSISNVKMGEQKITGNSYFFMDGLKEKDEDEPKILGNNYKDIKYMQKNVNEERKMSSEDKVCNDIKEIFSRIFSTTEKMLKKGKTNRAVLIAKRDTFLCFRHFFGDETEGFDMRLYEVVRGNLEGGEKEYVYKPYLNSSRKKE